MSKETKEHSFFSVILQKNQNTKKKKKFDNKLVVIVVFRSYTFNVSTLYHSQPIHSYGHNENHVCGVCG